MILNKRYILGKGLVIRNDISVLKVIEDEQKIVPLDDRYYSKLLLSMRFKVPYVENFILLL